MYTVSHAADLIAGAFPHSREAVETASREAIPWYAVASEGFWWPILEPALQSGDEVSIRRALEIVELVVREGEPDLRDAFAIRVAAHLVPWEDSYGPWLGPLTHEQVVLQRGE